MTLKNAVTKGVKAWRDRRVGYWLCIDPKTGEYYLLTSANLAELNGLKAMYKSTSRSSRRITNLNFTKMVFVYDIGKSRWQADFGREALEFGRDHFTIDTGNYVITVDPKRYRIFDRAAGKPLVNGVVRIDEQDMKDILAAAPKSQRGWIRTRLGYMVVL